MILPANVSTRNAPQADTPKLIPGNTYLLVHDNSLEGILSAVFVARSCPHAICELTYKEKAQPRLGQIVQDIPVNIAHATRVKRTLLASCGAQAFKYIVLAASSDDKDTGAIIYRFICTAMQSVCNPCRTCAHKATCMKPCTFPTRSLALLQDIARPEVRDLIPLARFVVNERHYLQQFIRFKETKDGFWYAECTPKAKVIPLVMYHFAARFNTEKFAIYDKTHGVVGMYAHLAWDLVKVDTLKTPKLADQEYVMQQAWKTFYQATSIQYRYNPELRQHFMPRRFWKDIVEMREDCGVSCLPHDAN